jgi:glycosyltransferase involved in cell wall biosynthesis
MPLFSVIIPTHNRLPLLREALDSVWAQTFTDFEVIVVDDGSTDGTWEYLQGLGARVRAFRQENAGPGAARNRGAQQAGGEYIAFFDSDDRWFPWTLEIFGALIKEHNQPAILSAQLRAFADPSELAGVRQELSRAEVFSDYFAAADAGYFVGSGMAVLRREIFLKTGGFTHRRINAEDHDLILRMGDAPGFVQVLAPVTLGWRRHSTSATANARATFDGKLYLVKQEQNGNYPGGAARVRDRRKIITRHVRSSCLECLRAGLRSEAWALYRATFRWHLALGRWKFLAGFPLKAVCS